jgi:hypothetical protein
MRPLLYSLLAVLLISCSNNNNELLQNKEWILFRSYGILLDHDQPRDSISYYKKSEKRKTLLFDDSSTLIIEEHIEGKTMSKTYLWRFDENNQDSIIAVSDGENLKFNLTDLTDSELTISIHQYPSFITENYRLESDSVWTDQFIEQIQSR